jgi:hypothetical protein
MSYRRLTARRVGNRKEARLERVNGVMEFVPESRDIKRIAVVSQSEYDALLPTDPNTLYWIVG